MTSRDDLLRDSLCMRHDLSGAKHRSRRGRRGCCKTFRLVLRLQCLEMPWAWYTPAHVSLCSLSISVPVSGSQQLHELQDKLFTSFTAARRAFAFSLLCLRNNPHAFYVLKTTLKASKTHLTASSIKYIDSFQDSTRPLHDRHRQGIRSLAQG